MTCKKGLVLYYSMTGNTKAMVNLFSDERYDKIIIRKDVECLGFEGYEVIIIATSTWGRGIPPKPFFQIRDKLAALSNKKIALIGSGRTEFEHFCGALDLLEERLSSRNEILFKYKFEGYPKQKEIEDVQIYIKEMES